jgi:hypothetical protein
MFEGNSEIGDNFNDTDRGHQLMPARQIVDERQQVLNPMHKQMKKFIQSGDNRRDRKTEM